MSARPARHLKYGTDARERLLRGIELVAQTVGPTLGPNGRLVVLDSRFGTPEISPSAMDRKFGSPLFSRDGFSIAREILIGDSYVNQGAILARHVAGMTKLGVGDGSTTAILLFRAMVREGFRLIAAGVEFRGLERGMIAAVEAMDKAIENAARPVDSERDRQRIATRSAGGDPEMGRLVAAALDAVGGGFVDFEDGRLVDSSLEVRNEFPLERGYVSPHLVTDRAAGQAELQDCFVLVVDETLGTARQLIPILDQVSRERRPLFILATGIEPDAMALLTVNLLQKKVIAVPVLAPGSGEGQRQVMEDVALLTGATVVGAQAHQPVESCGLDVLGVADHVLVRSQSTTIRGGHGDPGRLSARTNMLAAGAAEAESLHDYEAAERRRARLAGEGVAVIRVGGATDSEIDERRRRGQDALRALRSAQEKGVVPGGGTSLLRAAAAAAPDLLDDDEYAGALAIQRAAEEPLRQLAVNAGLEPGMVVARVRHLPAGRGLDVDRGEFCDLAEVGIVEPAAVVQAALANAAFYARRVLGTEALIVQPEYAGRYRQTATEGGPANLSMP